MGKSNNKIVLLCLILALSLSFSLFPTDWLSIEERDWLDANRQNPMHLGFDPQAGIEYFTSYGRELGLMPALARLIEDTLDLSIVVEKDKTWGEAYRGLQSGSIDILFGANETEERKKIMSFTEPLFRIPYSLLAQSDMGIYVVGDLEDKKVAFIDGDIIFKLFPGFYSRINYEPLEYSDQEEALSALERGEADAFITSGGIVIYDYLKKYPSVKEITVLEDFTSDMTLSVRKDKEILASILNKWIASEKEAIQTMIDEVQMSYNYKIMDLTEQEIQWIEQDGEARIGVAYGYLPFEVIRDGEFKGITSSILREVTRLTGIDFIPEGDDFQTLFNKAVEGEIHVLNLAKTPERENFFFYTRPFSKERDVIYGHRESDFVQDIYGLRGSKVAIVEGYWHKELLEKNAIEADFLITESLSQSMEAVLRGDADYMIENPSVMKYFIQEWELFDLTEKGMTSYNSFLYFGITRQKPQLASIMDKSLNFIDLERAIHRGYNEVPYSQDRKRLFYLMALVAMLVLILSGLIIFTYRQAKDLIKSRRTAERLKEREELMYRDSMTQLYNRHYLYHKVEPYIRKWKYPQCVIVWDLNNLKLTNDKWGHAAGDQLLARFGQFLIRHFSSEDKLIRMGGDEFMILTMGLPEKVVRRSVEDLNEMMDGRPLVLESGEEIPISSAWGMSVRQSNQDKTFEELLREADASMYTHKKEMKDSFRAE